MKLSPACKGFLFAIGAALLGDAGDVVTTWLSNGVPGIVEMNPLMRNGGTDAFIPYVFAVKGMHWGLMMVPLCAALRCSLKNALRDFSWTIASLPLLWSAYETFNVTFGNAAVLFRATR